GVGRSVAQVQLRAGRAADRVRVDVDPRAAAHSDQDVAGDRLGLDGALEDRVDALVAGDRVHVNRLPGVLDPDVAGDGLDRDVAAGLLERDVAGRRLDLRVAVSFREREVPAGRLHADVPAHRVEADVAGCRLHLG